MKNLRLIISLSFALLFISVSCNEDDLVTYGDETNQGISDPFLQILTPVISFQAGTPSYLMEFNVVNGLKRLTAVEVYMTFTDAVSGAESNEALLATYTLDADDLTVISDELTYAELKAGLIVNGSPLPDNEVDLAIGSGWKLRFLGKRAEGDIGLPGSIRVGVLSRFAGNYKVIESAYYRIGVFSSNWNGQTRFIGSVDATTFSYNDYWGPFGWGGQSFNFSLNEVDNFLTVPILTASGLFSGTRAINCTDDGAIFTNVPCAGQNVLIPDDAGGKHVIKLTYGYFTDGSGPREFYEILEKI
ncbi:MAG: hypothetical protein SH808_06820 [Saprospiraceae bacterium]|nr:hypothetical protein [Saprospiraceae bacterium]